MHRQDQIKTALRVLAAITESRYPDPADIEQLRQAAPYASDLPVDELACEVIQRGITRREPSAYE